MLQPIIILLGAEIVVNGLVGAKSNYDKRDGMRKVKKTFFVLPASVTIEVLHTHSC